MRALAIQVLAVVLVAWVGAVLLSNTLDNMERRNIQTGFGFLNQPAGFGILFSLIPYDESHSYGRTFVVGLLNTILVSGLGVISATVLGFAGGIARLSRNWLVARLAGLYIEIFRNIPLLLQVFFWYFAVLKVLPPPRHSIALSTLGFLNNRGLYIPRPVFGAGMGWVLAALAAGIAVAVVLGIRARRRFETTGNPGRGGLYGLGFAVGLPLCAFVLTGAPLSFSRPVLAGFNFRGGMVLLPELVALWLALTIYTGTYIAEIVRAGILAVSPGQIEAASALGLKRPLIIRLVVLPQALRVIVPPLTSQYLNLTKNSSLATAIGYPDLVNVFMGTTLNQTGQAVEIVAMTMAVYLTLSLSISAAMNLYNRRVALHER